MRKSIYKTLAAVAALILIFTLSACGGIDRIPLTVDEFISEMQDAGYTIKDVTEQYDEGSVEQILLAYSEDYQIEFFVLPSKGQALRAFNENKSSFKLEEGSTSSNANVELNNYGYYMQSSNDQFYVVAFIDNTMIYAKVDDIYKKEVTEIIKSLGYLSKNVSRTAQSTKVGATINTPKPTQNVINNETQTIGNDEYGYLDIPSSWVMFQDTDPAPGIISYCNGTPYTIIHMNLISGVDAQTAFERMLESKQNELGEKNVGSVTTTIANEFRAYELSSQFPDGIVLTQWFFSDADGSTHYIALEAPKADIQSLFYIIKTYRLQSESEQGSSLQQSANSGNISSDWEDLEFIFDGQKYSMPLKYKDLEAAGWVANDKYIGDTLEKNSWLFGSVELTNPKYDYYIQVGFINTSEFDKNILDCEIDRFDFDLEFQEGARCPEMIVCGGLTFGNTLKQIQDVFGYKCEIKNGTYKTAVLENSDLTKEIEFELDENDMIRRIYLKK